MAGFKYRRVLPSLKQDFEELEQCFFLTSSADVLGYFYKCLSIWHRCPQLTEADPGQDTRGAATGATVPERKMNMLVVMIENGSKTKKWTYYFSC